MAKFIGDYYMWRPELPPLEQNKVLEYWVASNGLFVRARRPGLEATIPVALYPIPIAGLYPLSTQIRFDFEPVPQDMVRELLAQSYASRDEHREHMVEILFHLRWQEGRWSWTKPDQLQQYGSVTPLQRYETSQSAPLIDLHSHHSMAPFFSSTDTTDEQGFRIFAVWGFLDSTPTICARIGIFGHFAPVSARQVFALPPFVRDGEACERGWEGRWLL